MNDIKRTVIWVVFGFSMVLLWDQWQIYNGQKPTFFPPKQEQLQAAKGTNTQGTNAQVPLVGDKAPTELIAQGESKEQATQQTYVFKNDVLELTISSEGASIVKTKFLKQVDQKNPTENITLLEQSANRVYMAQTGLIASNANELPNHKTHMELVGTKESKSNEEPNVIEFTTVGKDGLRLIKTFTLYPGQYDLIVKHTVINQSNQAIEPKLYVQLVRDGNKPEGESSFYSTFTGPAVYTEEKKYQKINFKDIEKNEVSIQNHSSEGYVAMVQHYYASAWVFPDTRERELFAKKVDNNLYSVGMISTLKNLNPGEQTSTEAKFFSGPQEEKRLEAIYPGLELVKDYGWLTILAKPLYWLLFKINTTLGNWGWSIVALVLMLKAAFFWLNAQAYKSMAKMKAINPKIMEMRERLKDKPQQIQMEMMRIYKEEKVNPMGGCLPIMIQIPVFIALYWVLLSTVEMRNTPWVGWIKDLSAPDPFFILPALMTLTSLLQTWLNPTPPDPIQAKMMWIMPLAFSVMFFFFPSGLVLYWLTNNILSITQQWLINKKLGVTR
jgi:YidC/Oxa1 family membrane protein insertase